MYRKLILIFIIYVSIICSVFSQSNYIQNTDSLKKTRDLLKEAQVVSEAKEIQVSIRNVDISKFPEINVVIEAFNIFGQPLDTLSSEKLTVLENGKERKVISVKRLSLKERVPVDFIFIIDKTGSMQNHIDAVLSNISTFSTNLMKRGIDYKLGLVLFSDEVENVYQPTDNVVTFLNWLQVVKAKGGGDEKENALEAMKNAITRIKYRPSANKVFVLITDAPYHQKGEAGDGTTDETTESMINMLADNGVRLFATVPPKLKSYKQMCDKTRGTAYDIDYPFSTILDQFSQQLTNLFALKYRTDLPAIPDSINIALLSENRTELVRKTIPIVELGRKLIIENLLYKTNKFDLPDSVRELEVLHEFMVNKPNVTILIEGHTDSKGSNEINDALSLRRAESVKTYLVKKGINSLRIQTKGFGKRKPIADNNSEFGRQLNRRTEIVIVSK